MCMNGLLCLNEAPWNLEEVAVFDPKIPTGGCHTVNKRIKSSSELACLRVWNTMFCLNLPHLNLWFKVWHQSVSCRVAGTGNTLQQLPVCFADGYASHVAIVCQHHSSLNLFTNSLSGWEFPSEASQYIIPKTDPHSSPKIAKLM